MRMSNIPKEKWFYFHDGRTAGSLKELEEIINTISDDEMQNYIGIENHFSNWIEMVLNKKTLAEKLRDATTKEDVLTILEENHHHKKHVVHKSHSHHKKNTSKEEVEEPKEISKHSQSKSFKDLQDMHITEDKKLSNKDVDELAHDIKRVVAMQQRKLEESKHKFIVKEFIYGFIIGLIFGVIMIGLLQTL
jgi:tetrahydromethanopterin S-methyltransferase subunit F